MAGSKASGVTLSPELMERIRVLASTIHHGSITLHLNAERDSVDVEVVSRDRVKL